MGINENKRYRVEVKNHDNHFRVDCDEKDLEFWKAMCKYEAIEIKGNCYYREFPVSKNKKIYYSKDILHMTMEELEIILKRLKKEE